MLKVLLFVSLLIVAALAVSPVNSFARPVPGEQNVNDDELVLSREFLQQLESKQKSWTAGSNEGSAVDGVTYRQARRMMGVKRNGFKLAEKKFSAKELSTVNALPTSFNAADQWPQCKSINTILDQSACGSCWAFGAKEAIWDRYCIHNNITNVNVSVNDLVACCDSCGFGCGGGDPGSAFDYWVQTGLVTDTCLPYPFPSCDHHLNNSKMPCPSNEYPSPSCPKPRKCSDSETWDNVIHKGKSSYSITKGMTAIMTEIYNNGPVETAFDVYADFLGYSGGVYHHTSGSFLGGHAVKFVGWGQTSDGTLYWIVNNSWNVHWGLNGTFWIRRGNNECGIESEVWGGVPLN